MVEKILVTTALPYANGSIHLGHILEGIQADIWVRYQRAIGKDCYFFCADDTHGTPVMIAAQKAGITPEEYIKKVHEEHYRDLTGFEISYDNYYSTNSPENQTLAEEIYLSLLSRGSISARNIEQAYCEHDKMFLPDRFIKGTCPKCGAKDQYGDSCEVCGATYSPVDLLEPRCAICGSTPVTKESRHLFFRLQDYERELKQWIETEGRLPEGGRKKLLEWFEAGLKEWDISRDGPYFGFPIPGEENKFFYVWLDAPVGYMASSKHFFADRPEIFDEFWKQGFGKIVHFIGKDILYFHGLFWPAMLIGAGFSCPSQIHVHGFMTVNGEKMSKSRGTFVNAATFLKYNDPEHFRYYMAARLGPGMEDVDISFEDFLTRVNSDLIGNLVNSISRISTSLLDKLDRRLGTVDDEGKKILSEIRSKEPEIRRNYEEKNYQKVIREITALGDIVNRYVNDKAPWMTVKTDPEKTRIVLTNALNAGFLLFTYLYPVIPNIVKKVYKLLKVESEPKFSFLHHCVEGIMLPTYVPLSSRPSRESIEKMIEETKKDFMKPNDSIQDNQTSSATETNLISIEEFQKLEIRIGLILEADYVEGSDKLIRIQLDLGNLGTKNVFAGIRSAYEPKDLVGMKVAAVTNLHPRKMKFGVSEAMLLASGSGKNLSLLIPHRNALPGDLLK